MSTLSHVAADLLVPETGSDDEFYECNSMPETETIDATDNHDSLPVEPLEETSEISEGSIISFGLPPSEIRFYSIEEAYAFLDEWTRARGYSLRLYRQGNPNLTGKVNSVYLVCDRSNPRNRKKSDNDIALRNKGTMSQNCHFRMTPKRSSFSSNETQW